MPVIFVYQVKDQTGSILVPHQDRPDSSTSSPTENNFGHILKGKRCSPAQIMGSTQNTKGTSAPSLPMWIFLRALLWQGMVYDSAWPPSTHLFSLCPCLCVSIPRPGMPAPSCNKQQCDSHGKRRPNHRWPLVQGRGAKCHTLWPLVNCQGQVAQKPTVSFSTLSETWAPGPLALSSWKAADNDGGQEARDMLCPLPQLGSYRETEWLVRTLQTSNEARKGCWLSIHFLIRTRDFQSRRMAESLCASVGSCHTWEHRELGTGTENGNKTHPTAEKSHKGHARKCTTQALHDLLQLFESFSVSLNYSVQ